MTFKLHNGNEIWIQQTWKLCTRSKKVGMVKTQNKVCRKIKQNDIVCMPSDFTPNNLAAK